MFGKKSKDKEIIEKVREFDLKNLPRDENGEIILPDDLTYAEFLHLTHPELTEGELRRKMAKENVATWMVRFVVLAFIALIGLIIFLHVTSS